MPLTKKDLEKLKISCDANGNLSLVVEEKIEYIVYKSRFLHFDLENNSMIIDFATPEIPDSPLLSKNQKFNIFFTFKDTMYYFTSRIIDHTMFTINEINFRALIIKLPLFLEEGQRRDYFRIQTPTNPAINVFYHVIEKEDEVIVKANGKEEDEHMNKGDICDISGGGIAMKISEKDDNKFEFRKGDLLKLKFRLELDMEEMEIWCKMRHKRKQKDSPFVILGVQFINDDRNKDLKIYRSKIMRYVIKRQRELMI